MTTPQIPSNASIVILTGAGISAESGIDTFRDKGGIWEKNRIEDVATPEAFARNPEHVNAFYNARRQGLLSTNITPNAAHEALARLAREWSGDVLLVTQNIDDLHERSGTTNLIHMHGELRKARCTSCATVQPCDMDINTATRCPACDNPGTTRPHVVWFGEMPLEMARIDAALEQCGLFLSIGTSGNVYPAAGFVQRVIDCGVAHTVELNLEPSSGRSLFAEHHDGLASVIVPAYVDTLLAGIGKNIKIS